MSNDSQADIHFAKKKFFLDNGSQFSARGKKLTRTNVFWEVGASFSATRLEKDPCPSLDIPLLITTRKQTTRYFNSAPSPLHGQLNKPYKMVAPLATWGPHLLIKRNCDSFYWCTIRQSTLDTSESPKTLTSPL